MSKETLNDYPLECPHCGYRIGDGWELHQDDDDTRCPKCGKDMLYSGAISVSDTAKAKDAQ